MTWLDRILATPCEDPDHKDGPGNPCLTVFGKPVFCTSRIQAAEGVEAKPGRPWWVHYSNYFPREVDSVWPTREAAEKRRDELNDQSDGGMWECENI